MSNMASEVIINFFTLNCWGIPYVSRSRKQRMTAIADVLALGEYDIISLQEVWLVSDFKMIRSKVEEQLPYSHYFYSGVFGSGICIFSRYPIEDVMFHKWPLNGYIHKIHHGDWFGGKGIGLCRLKVGNIKVNVYVAHLHAEYNKENDEYLAHRVLQAFDTAQFIRMTRGGVDAVILGGDLNTEPQDLANRIICGVAGLIDACPDSNSNLGTNECANNSYTPSKIARKAPEGKRIDYVMYLGSKTTKVKVENFRYPLPKCIPYKNFSYSDHEAVMATLKLTDGECNASSIDVRGHLKEAITICKSALKSVCRQRYCYLFFGCILIIPLLWSLELDYINKTNSVISLGFNILRLLLAVLLCYTLFMSTIWNQVEKNALKAGVSAMEIHLLQLTNTLSKN